MKTENIFLSLGSNLGNREEMLLRAIGEIDELGEVKNVSEFYDFPPWGKTDQPDFLNTVLKISTNLTPEEMLREIKQIEKKLGRKKREKWEPREIDIDILFWNQEIIDTDNLKIPHPHWKEREFVKVPFREIAEKFIPPDETRNFKLRKTKDKL